MAPSSPLEDGGVALASGLLAGFATTVALHPLDLLKTRFQVDESLRKRPFWDRVRGSTRAGAKAVLGSEELTVRAVLRQLGPAGLYRGVVPAVIGSSASWGIYWSLYEPLKAQVAGESQRRLSAFEYLWTSALAGAMTVLCTNPIWLIKTRIELQTPGNEPYRGVLHAVRTIVRQEGLAGLYKGIVPALFLTSNGAVQFVVYEELKHLNADPGPTDFMVMGAVSKSVASTITYPYQVVKSRMQQHQSRYTSTIETFRLTVQHQGWTALYRGIVPNLLRVMPASAITFATYEQSRAYLTALVGSRSDAPSAVR